MKSNIRKLSAIALSVILFLQVSINYVQADVAEPHIQEAPLSEMTTESLISQILEGNYWIDIFCLDSTDATYNYWYSKYELFRELETRTDAGEKLANISVLLNATNNTENNPQVFFQHAIIVTLLSQPEYFAQLAKADNSSLYSFQSLTRSSTEISQPEFFVDYLGYATYTHVGEHTTPSYKHVFLYQANRDFFESAKDALVNETLSEYPHLQKISTATTIYNCHSYAWYMQSTSNPYWVLGVDRYVEDPHYTTVSKSSAKVGDIVVYSMNGEYTHSAVITSVSTGSSMVPIISCQSKWGQDGLYGHSIEYVHAAYTDLSSPTYIIIRPVTVHNYTGTYAKNNDSNHKRYCSYCNVYTLLAHKNTVTSNASTHTQTCKDCGWTKTSAHSYNTITSKCTVCGRLKDTSTPILPSKKQDAITIS